MNEALYLPFKLSLYRNHHAPVADRCALVGSHPVLHCILHYPVNGGAKIILLGIQLFADGTQFLAGIIPQLPVLGDFGFDVFFQLLHRNQSLRDGVQLRVIFLPGFKKLARLAGGRTDFENIVECRKWNNTAFRLGLAWDR